jgi:hypothetical protein
MATELKNKRTIITPMGAKTQAFDIFPTPYISHWSLSRSQHLYPFVQVMVDTLL